ncbi:hypothetical protein ACKFC9_001656 [Campylobacter jejuni]
MSEQERELALFNLGKSLVELLGEEQAIADLNLLYERHPEMFRDKQEVKEVIEKVVNEPEIIVDATHSNKDIGIFKALKKLDSEKMGDVVIKNDSGTNVIFHANKKKISEFHRMEKQIKTGSRDAHFLHPDIKSAWAGSKEHLPVSDEIIPKLESKNQPKTPIDFQAKFKEFTQKQAQEKNPSKDKEINR